MLFKVIADEQLSELAVNLYGMRHLRRVSRASGPQYLGKAQQQQVRQVHHQSVVVQLFCVDVRIKLQHRQHTFHFAFAHTSYRHGVLVGERNHLVIHGRIGRQVVKVCWHKAHAFHHKVLVGIAQRHHHVRHQECHRVLLQCLRAVVYRKLHRSALHHYYAERVAEHGRNLIFCAHAGFSSEHCNLIAWHHGFISFMPYLVKKRVVNAIHLYANIVFAYKGKKYLGDCWGVDGMLNFKFEMTYITFHILKTQNQCTYHIL